MNRDYTDGTKSDVTFFVGIEIEKTPAYGMKTLFVVGVHNPKKIAELAYIHECQHVFAGANHSYDPTIYSLDEWDGMISPLLTEGLLVTLDFDAKFTETVLASEFSNHNNFIPQISVKIPNITRLNYNTMLKIDDRDFKATNPGVWCHSLHDLMDRDVFTAWREYEKDKPL